MRWLWLILLFLAAPALAQPVNNEAASQLSTGAVLQNQTTGFVSQFSAGVVLKYLGDCIQAGSLCNEKMLVNIIMSFPPNVLGHSKSLVTVITSNAQMAHSKQLVNVIVQASTSADTGYIPASGPMTHHR